MGTNWADSDIFLRRATVEQDWSFFNERQAWVESDYDITLFHTDAANLNTTDVTAALDRRLVSMSNGHLAFVQDSNSRRFSSLYWRI